ncbi:folate family ECF transporter S component [Caproiciproducens sp. NJN-50]|uniref:folate family ECF transporter S component n=1 Tax=Acutalibacteraceae TaxID=3082771 RepID=UPI000FFE3179|nr:MULTISPECIES: folate family ECF transporter S component [Acutalibacteraceae]QAT50230.1 folate family ECF transporter S component [Caproiciproducens sp. NJN-50]
MLKNKIRSIFTPKYWITACSEFRNPRSLVFAGLTISLSTVLSSLYIPVGVNLRITTAFLALALGSMIFGPVVGLSAGLAYDLIGYLLIPATVFFPGYTLSSMLEFFIYGIFLYQCKISVLRVFVCKLIIDFGIHVGLGCLWSSMLYDKGYYYFFVKSLIKNSIMLPLEVVMLVAVLQVFLPVLAHQGVIPKQKSKYIPLI